MAFVLSEKHIAAANRTRRLISHYDAYTPMAECGGMEAKNGQSFFETYKKRLWGYLDTLNHQIDSIHWDACFEDEFAFCHKSSLPQVRKPICQTLLEENADLYEEFVNGCRQRGLECILSHRISGTDLAPGNEWTPMKKAHAEYYIDDWMRMQNLAVPEIRAQKLSMLRECMENYAFDGLEIDFCRHTPFLEPGKQWELREHVTGFLRSLREMTLKLEEEQGRAILLSCRVPETVEGCHIDGLDIETWAEERIVDTLTLGTRSFEVDISGFRRATKGRIQLFPCYDAHHQSDAYADPDVDVYAGLFSSWWEQGADGIVLFNLYACDWQTYMETCAKPFTPHTHHQEEMLTFAGDCEKIKDMDKTFVVERRGGYPWENGFANNNNNKQLPEILPNNGARRNFMVYVSEDVAHKKAKKVTASIVVYGLVDTDELSVALNGLPLRGEIDRAWQDKQIVPLGKEYVSGYHTDWLPERPEKFARLLCDVPAWAVKKGENTFEVSVNRNGCYPYVSRIECERLELTVREERQNDL